VPFVDVVTTMLDATIPLTTFEREEWGDPHNPADFQFMLSYSPYDQVTAQQYPHMLVSTGLWDPAVQYWEPAKWVAKLRACKTGASRLLLWVDMQAGHSGHSGRYESLKDTARELAFVFDVLGIEL
jgi:oligopeptidase B